MDPSAETRSLKGLPVDQVASAHDLVVLDCPPLLLVEDTLSIVPKVDAVMLCVRIGQTASDEAVAARTALRRLPRTPTGLVVTGVKSGGPDDYAGYYSSSVEEPPEVAETGRVMR